ncbi:hypothetical protein B0H19DRAFT_1066047 [Mycena capillaripes]|nr:hypothetical protein B0H19DRAFT_1066047 [Mycena capillaripes]
MFGTKAKDLEPTMETNSARPVKHNQTMIRRLSFLPPIVALLLPAISLLLPALCTSFRTGFNGCGELFGFGVTKYKCDMFHGWAIPTTSSPSLLAGGKPTASRSCVSAHFVSAVDQGQQLCKRNRAILLWFPVTLEVTVLQTNYATAMDGCGTLACSYRGTGQPQTDSLKPGTLSSLHTVDLCHFSLKVVGLGLGSDALSSPGEDDKIPGGPSIP